MDKISKTCIMDVANIISAAGRDSYASAIQCLMRILPPGWVGADKNIQHILLQEDVIQHVMSREVFRAQEYNNISKIRRIARIYHRHNLDDIEFNVCPSDFINDDFDIDFDETGYNETLRTADLAIETFQKTRMALQKWDLVRQVTKSIQDKILCKKRIALMKMGRNPIIDQYLLRKVFIPRFETFGFHYPTSA